MTKASSERRRERRVPVQIQIQYKTADGFFQDYIRNLSLGGIFIETEKPLPMNTKLRVEFCLPAMEDPITADGIVVHTLRVGQTSKPTVSGMGIRFSDLETTSKQIIESYLKVNAGPAPT
jgi:type IV pilus assembly protein PilZ